jgi:riboflavin-specific deaminase-like protein
MNLNQQIEDWLVSSRNTFQPTHRPFVTLAYAQGWDGSITTRRGDVFPLSGPQSNRLTHQIRSLHDGILVGVDTVLSDDPQLTVREWNGPNPQPIVLDSQLRMPQNARLFHHPDKQCWILSLCENSGAFGKQAEIITLKSDDPQLPQVPLPEALYLLRQKGIRSLMIEGGARIITAFLRARLADAVIITVAPRLIGGYKAIGSLATLPVEQLPYINPLHHGMLGDDIIVWGRLQYGLKAA